jgi:hypothetical protein
MTIGLRANRPCCTIERLYKLFTVSVVVRSSPPIRSLSGRWSVQKSRTVLNNTLTLLNKIKQRRYFIIIGSTVFILFINKQR